MNASANMPRSTALAPLLALGAFLTVLLSGLLLPVYTDEIGWRFQERAAVDGVDSMFNDLCGANTLAAAPWFMMPVRFFSAMANQSLASPLFVRMEGIACSLAFLALLWVLTARLESDVAARSRLRAVLFGLLALGILPFLMTFSRPEQPVVLMLSLAMLTAIGAGQDNAATPRTAMIKCAAIVLFGCIALSYHLKAVVYAPVFLACIAMCSSGRKTLWPRIAGGAALLGLTLASALYWIERFQCRGDVLLAEKLGEENVAAVLGAGGSWMDLTLSLATGLNPLNYFWLAVPADNAGWLPGGQWSPEMTTLFVLAIFLLWSGVLALSLFQLAAFCWQRRWSALGEARVLIALALLGSLAAWGASQLHRNHYEATHYLPMTAILCALCLSLPVERTRVRNAVLDFFRKIGVPLAMASAAFMLFTTFDSMRAVTVHAGWIPGMRVSVSSFGYARVRQDIATAMERAGMGNGRRLNRLLVDDVTYLALQRHTMPLHRLGVLSDWNGSITDPVAYLRSRNSDGVVAGCHLLPPRMRDVAERAGEVCAISRAGLEQLAASGPTLLDQGEAR